MTEQKGMWVIIYCQYGAWYVTNDLQTKAKAEMHKKLYFDGERNNYKTHVEIRWLPLPDSAQ